MFHGASNWYLHPGHLRLGYRSNFQVPTDPDGSESRSRTQEHKGDQRRVPTNRYHWCYPFGPGDDGFSRATRTTYGRTDRYASKQARARTHARTRAHDVDVSLAARHDNATCVRATCVCGGRRRAPICCWPGDGDDDGTLEQCYNYYRLPRRCAYTLSRARSTSVDDASRGACDEGGKVTNPRPFAATITQCYNIICATAIAMRINIIRRTIAGRYVGRRFYAVPH